MREQGFTLIELLVVVIVIATLTSVALPQYRRAMDRAKAAEAMQMLPALFEARERWMIEHGCKWNNGGIVSCTAVLKASRLDIETKGTITENTRSDNNSIDEIAIQTSNFKYNLVMPAGMGKNQPCVTAKPLWGANRGLTGATIYYRGDKFSCTDGSTNGVCDILNIADSDHRSGCI